MSTDTKSSSMQILSKLVLIALCVLCLQPLSSCASESGEEGVINHVIKYATSRTLYDMSLESVVTELPDVQFEVSLLGVKETPSGVKEIEIEPVLISDTMASWSADEWAENRVDLFFNFAAHFTVICKQAHEFSNIPEDYNVTCPDYLVVYDSQKENGFIVSSTGVYQKTDDPENPIGEAIVVTKQD